MKIEYIKISNILSFKYHSDINSAQTIGFDDGLNILIGQNGAGKSTALEVINFIFKKVIFVAYNVDQDLYTRRNQLNAPDIKNVISRYDGSNHFRSFRLDANWNSPDKEQKIQIKIRLDDIDKHNLDILEKNKHHISSFSGKYSNISSMDFSYPEDSFIIDIILDPQGRQFSYSSSAAGGGLSYLIQYNYYKELIDIANSESSNKIEPLRESFTLIGGYRNYNAFTPSISLAQEPLQQMQNLRNNEFVRSANSSEQTEPPIFSLVRLRVAALHMDGVFTNLNEEQATIKANQEPFLVSINNKLALINLKVEIVLQNRNSWSYSFRFVDLNSRRILSDINSLSAGQKSIIHLIFESYGRSEFKGGVVIIDEPEIHLHYQFQYEYLRIIERLNLEQKSQYILVTHSEALISSKTIDKVKRFALDADRSTVVKAPTISADQKTLIKILDNTRSTYAFFARKVVLVEGDSDRYFFRAVFQELKPEQNQEIAILDIGGKGNYEKWKTFFNEFGLEVYYIGDFDNVFSLEHLGSKIISKGDKQNYESILKQENFNNMTASEKANLVSYYRNLIADAGFLNSPQLTLWQPFIDFAKKFLKVDRTKLVTITRANNTNIETIIEALYASNIFILKKGVLEDYTETSSKTLDAVITFCQTINTWLSTTSPQSEDIKNIVSRISA